MDKEEIIRRLKNISEHAVHVVGEEPFIMSLDDGIALDEAVSMLEEQEAKTVAAYSFGETRIGRCPRCERTIINIKSSPTRFCRYCGQEVKWSETD